MATFSFLARAALFALVLLPTACCGKIGGTFQAEWKGPFQSVLAQSESTCAVRPAGPAQCWGSDPLHAKIVFPAGPFTRLSGTAFELCGLRPTGDIVCAGRPSPAGRFLDFAVQFDELCSIDQGNLLLCRRPRPGGDEIRHPGALKVLFDGTDDVCSLDVDGSVGCFRRRQPDPSAIPNPGRTIVLPGRFVDFSLLDGRGCALRDDGTAACWGDPLLVPPAGLSFTQLSVGGDKLRGGAACGLVAGGSIVCFGAKLGGLPMTIPTGTFQQISLHELHACALRTNGDIFCWGEGSRGQVTGRWWA